MCVKVLFSWSFCSGREKVFDCDKCQDGNKERGKEIDLSWVVRGFFLGEDIGIEINEVRKFQVEENQTEECRWQR